MPPGLKYTERMFHSQLALISGVSVPNVVEFKLNKLYTALHLRISATLTVSAGGDGNYVSATNPILALIRNINLTVSGDGICYNIPGTAAYHLAARKLKVAPRIDNASFNPNAAASYVMSVHIPLLFADPLMARPWDTILDTSRYSSMNLSVQMGAGTDAVCAGVGTGATFTLSAMTCDIETETLPGAPRASARPWFFAQYTVEGAPKNVASETSATIMRAQDRLLKRLLVVTTNGGAVSRPCSGAGSSAIMDIVQFGDGSTYFDKDRRDEAILDENAIEYRVATTAGVYLIDYVKDKFNTSALSTGDKAELRLGYTVSAAAPATLVNMVSVISETLNKLK